MSSDVMTTCELLIKILDKLFDGKKPPDEITSHC